MEKVIAIRAEHLFRIFCLVQKKWFLQCVFVQLKRVDGF